MDANTSPQTWVEIIKTAGPFVVALGSLAFNYLQSKRLAEINHKKDIEIAEIQQKTIILEENLKSKNAYLIKLEEIYSPILAKTEAILQNYFGLVFQKTKSIEKIQEDLLNYLSDDYIAFSMEVRKTALAKAIVICHTLKNHKAYELASQFDYQITQALALIDISGKSSEPEHYDALKQAQDTYRLTYVAFFYCIVNDEVKTALP
ncbi:hypothetical protein E4695_17370, partial [Alcaligenaceae bacterium 429]